MEDDVDKYYKELDPLHPDNFRSRGERAQRMKFPKDTTFRIIIPSSKGGYGFDSKNVDCTNFPGVNRLMIKQTAEEATRICEHIYTAKKKEEVKDRHKWSYFALKVALCLCLVGFCILMIPVYTTGKERSDIIYIGLLTFMLSILLTTGIVVRTVCMKRDSTSLEESILKELKTYVDKENSTVYSRLNCQLYIGYKFFWLELRKIES